jgi:predicted secreted protein
MAITTAKGTVLQISDVASPPVYTNVSQVRSITGPTVKPHVVDITTHDTPGFWRRKMAVLIDAGDISFEINFDHSDVSHAFTTGMWNQMVGLINSGWKMIFPAASGTLTFKGYIGQHEFNVPVDNVLAAKIQVAITDPITGV